MVSGWETAQLSTHLPSSSSLLSLFLCISISLPLSLSPLFSSSLLSLSLSPSLLCNVKLLCLFVCRLVFVTPADTQEYSWLYTLVGLGDPVGRQGSNPRWDTCKANSLSSAIVLGSNEQVCLQTQPLTKQIRTYLRPVCLSFLNYNKAVMTVVVLLWLFGGWVCGDHLCRSPGHSPPDGFYPDLT